MIEAVVGVNKAPFKTGLEELKASAGEFKAELGSMFVEVFAAGAIFEGTKGIFEEFSRVQDLADRFDISSVSIQKFGHAAELTGSSTEEFARSMKTLEVNISKVQEEAPGFENLVREFQNLGISVQDLKTLSPDEIMEKIGHSSMQASDMVAVMGKTALNIRPMLKGLADGSLELGQAVDEGTTKRIKAADDALTRWGQNIKTTSAEVLGKFINIPAELGFGRGKDWWKQQIEDLKADEKSYRELGDVDKAQDLNLQWRTIEAEHKPQGGDKKTGGESASDSWEEIKNDQAAMSQKLAEMDAAAAEKRLSIEQQILDAKKAEADLQGQFENETDPEKRKEIEKQILETHKQGIELIKQQKDGEDRAADEKDKYDQEMKTLDERVRKAQEQNLSPLEKEKALIEQIKQIDYRAHSGITPDRQLKEDQLARAEAVRQLRELSAASMRGITHPDVDSFRKSLGGGFAGVNYDYRNASADKQLEVLQEISKNTAKALDKKANISINQSSFGGGGTPGGANTEITA